MTRPPSREPVEHFNLAMPKLVLDAVRERQRELASVGAHATVTSIIVEFVRQGLWGGSHVRGLDL